MGGVSGCHRHRVSAWGVPHWESGGVRSATVFRRGLPAWVRCPCPRGRLASALLASLWPHVQRRGQPVHLGVQV